MAVLMLGTINISKDYAKYFYNIYKSLNKKKINTVSYKIHINAFTL